MAGQTQVKQSKHGGRCTCGLVFPERVGRFWEYPALFPLLESIELESIWFRQSSRPADRDEGDFLNRNRKRHQYHREGYSSLEKTIQQRELGWIQDDQMQE